jgi:hypothetical protein
MNEYVERIENKPLVQARRTKSEEERIMKKNENMNKWGLGNEKGKHLPKPEMKVNVRKY